VTARCTSRPEARGSGVDAVCRCLGSEVRLPRRNREKRVRGSAAQLPTQEIEKQPRLPTPGPRIGRCNAPSLGKMSTNDLVSDLQSVKTYPDYERANISVIIRGKNVPFNAAHERGHSGSRCHSRFAYFWHLCAPRRSRRVEL